MTKQSNKEATIDLSVYTDHAWRRYAMETIEGRALPDIFDGMKPVGRRVLYEMARMGLTPGAEPVKTARVVGNTMGKLHPHGDSSIGSAITTLVNSTIPPIRGIGNWGDRDDNPAAPRYTNCRLTKYGMMLVDKDYLAVTPMCPNYDGKELEPVVLPALLPNLFLNGGSGVAVSITFDLPPIEAKGILNLVRRILSGEEVTPRAAAKLTRVRYANGSYQVLTEPEDKAAWVEFWKTGRSTLRIQPKDYILDTKTATMIVPGIPLNLTMAKVIENLEADDRVKDVRNIGITKHGVDTIEIQLKPTRKASTVAQELFEDLITLVHPKLNAVQRKHAPVDDVDDIQTRIRSDSPLEILSSWCKLRVKLEQRYLVHKATRVKESIDYTNLLIKACLNRDVVLQALKSKTPDATLAKSLKISEEDAGRILDMQVRRLSVLDEAKLRESLKKLEAQLKELQAWQKKPHEKVIADIKQIESDLGL